MARFACILRWGSAALALGIPSLSHAATTSSSDSGTSSDSSASDSSASDSSASDSTGATETGTDSGTTGSCGPCSDPGTVTITTPNNGGNVDSPFELAATVMQRVDCDCNEVSPMHTRLYLDMVEYGERCYELDCSWTVDTMIGGHTLYVNAIYGPDDYVGSEIMVFVQTAATDTGVDTGNGTTDTSTSAAETSTSSGGGANDDSKGGCGCTTPARRSDAALGLLPLVLLLRRRRSAGH